MTWREPIWVQSWTPELVVLLALTHFLADFVLQSHWMSTNKSSKWTALLSHTFVYSFCFFWLGADFVAVTFVLHTVIDALSSRVTKALWSLAVKAELRRGLPALCVDHSYAHWFFVVIGLDQFLHVLSLVATWQWLIGHP